MPRATEAFGASRPSLDKRCPRDSRTPTPAAKGVFCWKPPRQLQNPRAKAPTCFHASSRYLILLRYCAVRRAGHSRRASCNKPRNATYCTWSRPLYPALCASAPENFSPADHGPPTSSPQSCMPTPFTTLFFFSAACAGFGWYDAPPYSHPPGEANAALHSPVVPPCRSIYIVPHVVSANEFASLRECCARWACRAGLG